jgi:succinoglycan biosynthesis transport protein ExoP
MADHQSDSEDFPLDIRRLTGLLILRRWWIIATCSASLLIAIAVSYLLPNRYTSDATILAVQQQVPERYVVPTSTTDVVQSLQAMTQEVLSRSRLMSVIEEFDLYRDQRRRLAPERLIELMRSNVSIAPLPSSDQRSINTFQISFTAETPHLAQDVVSRLSTLFIEENLKTRSEQSKTTTRFLREELETTKQRLVDQEQRVREFKMQYLGELPEQQQGNLGILSGLQTQLDNVMSNISRAKQQRLYLESLMAEYRRMRSPRTTPITSGEVEADVIESDPAAVARRHLGKLEADLGSLLTHYTDRYPDVIRKRQEIASQQQVVEALEAAKVSAKQSRPERPTGVQVAREAAATTTDSGSVGSESTMAIAQLRSQLEANRLEMEYLAKAESKLKAETEAYQSRLNLTPVREQQLTSLLRDYELIKQSYADLTTKELEAQLAASLEKRQEGQQFPASPKRLKISLIAGLAGLILGVALAFLADMRVAPVYSETEIARRLNLQVTGVPLILTQSEKRTAVWRRGLEVMGGCAVLIVVSLMEYYVFRHG